MMAWSNIAVIILALAVGWLALAPIRNYIGAWGYHIASIPVGLLAWAVVPTVSSLSGRGYDWVTVPAAHALWVGGIALTGWMLTRTSTTRSSANSVPLTTWPIAGAVALAAATAIAYLGLTVFQFDSLYHYHLPGRWLLEQGQIDGSIMAAYSVVIPSFQSAVLLLGGEWAYVVFPVLSLLALAALAGVLWADAFRDLGHGWRIALVAVVVGVLATMPNWVIHTLYVHSNMASAAYMTFAVISLAFASGFAGRRPAVDVWALPAGLATSGFALLRPDGLAFMFLPLALAIALLLGKRLSTRAYATFCVSAIVPVVAVYAAGLLELGSWDSDKLTGRTVVLLIAAAVVVSVAGWAFARVPQLGSWAARGYNAIRLAIVANIILVSVVVYRLREKSVPEFSNMLGNLVDSGGWGFFWFAATGIIAISLLFWQVTRRSAWSGYLLYTIAQFFFMAMMVYGLTDPGRLAWQDSFSRASLTIVPIVFWYCGTFLGAVAKDAPRRGAGSS